MRVGEVDTDERVLVVAEIGNNHEGDVGVARDLIERAAAAGVDAVKFQTFRTDAYVSPSDAERYARMQRFELSPDEFDQLAQLAHERSLLFISTPLDPASVDVLVPFADALKIASGDIDFYPLLERVSRTGKAVILSTGQSDLGDVDRAAAILGPGIGILHCVASYPAPANEINLRAIGRLAERYPNCTVGYSDHTVGLDAAPLAVACGARILEKHFTLDKHYSEFRDHALSVTPVELTELVLRVRAAEELLGVCKKEVQLSEGEMKMLLRRSVAAARALPAGHVLTEVDIMWTRPADGLRPGEEDRIISRALRRAVDLGEHLSPDDVL